MSRSKKPGGSGLLTAAERTKNSPAAGPEERKPAGKTSGASRNGAARKSPEPPKGEGLPFRIIGVDPGLASTGWGVLELVKGRLCYIAHGCIETGSDTPRGERLNLIYQSFLKVLKTYKPAEAAMENLYFGRNISSAMAVAEARGVLFMAMSARGLPVRELTPNDIKKAVTGVSRAEKKQVQEMVRFLLGLAEIPKPDHAADALGAAICAAHSGAVRPGRLGA